MLAINLFGVLLTKGELSRVDLNHEEIHTAQMKELLYVGFYLWYVLEWLIRLLQYGFSQKAYANISFEREAYLHQRDTGYLSRRKRFSWVRYL